ncbi:ABC transporter ATP-binding protein [Candidatus Amarolinea dominans]|uniref:ABC transporter ATP-binding protein n=1 Tax=Candidatus Amarolinea dominans TaxID=3140696 RepID=UPI00313666C3|nr:ABC transporter ATP-binding protein [Anaerolineae bacterium]
MSFEPALQVDGALKTFGKQGSGFALPFRKRSNGQATSNGATNGHLDGKSKQTVAVNRVSFSVPRGEIFGVLGPNGSGKSTLIRLIATLLIPDGGQINVFGHDVVKDPMAAQRLLNRVSVEASFFKKLSPMENLLYGARLYGVGASTARAQAKSILLRLGLEEKAIFQPMEEMSRGMQQKVAIARAFLTHPILLLLDEPTTGLDPRSKREVQAFVRELRDTHDATILLTTHDMMEADILCDRIAIIDGGNIVALDTPANLKQRIPQTNGHVPSLEEVFLQLTGKKLVTEDQVA